MLGVRKRYPYTTATTNQLQTLIKFFHCNVDSASSDFVLTLQRQIMLAHLQNLTQQKLIQRRHMQGLEIFTLSCHKMTEFWSK